MSRIEELINEKCPNGVTFLQLKDVCLVRQKEAITKSDLKEEGQYPVINSSRGILGFLDRYNNEADTLVLTSHGAYAGYCHYMNEKFFAGALCYPIQSVDNTKVITKYIYYWLKNSEEIIRDIYTNKSGVPYVNFKALMQSKIPIPPLEVQQEIARMLDSFTELEAELEAELTKRKQQYEYYRESLLSFEDANIQYYLLGEIAKFKTGTKPEKIFNVPFDGSFEYINAGTTNSGYTEGFNYEGSTVTTPSRGQGGIGFVGYQKNPFWLGPLCYGIQSKEKNVVTDKYLYYCLCSRKDEILVRKNEGGVPSLNAKDLATIKIPVPSVSKQNEIVSILDGFEAICGDLRSGLPAEIEARHKQYEYYRDKLLTFKERVV